MRKKLCIKKRLLIFSVLISAVTALMCAECLYRFPKQINIYEGEQLMLRSSSPYTLSVPAGFSGVLSEDKTVEEDSNSTLYATAKEEGVFEADIKLFGILPVRSVSVNVSKQSELIPCGKAIGIKMFTKGVLCVGTSDIVATNGKIMNLASQHDISPGDIILSANGRELASTEDFISIISNGKNVVLTIIRNDKKVQKSITPVLTHDGYKIGLWVRDSTAGIGTLTFVDPQSGKFGALGHPITDSDTGTLMPVSAGTILKAEIFDVKKGEKGAPGEIKGAFGSDNNNLGTISENTPCGIYGSVSEKISNFGKAVPVASRSEIKDGKAQIYANISGSNTEVFEIELKRVLFPRDNNCKDMIITVTDNTLLEKTGGIVQGMSGSPIIQNGKIVGAVTHVFVNDPTRGYGIFIENMLDAAG